MEVLFTIFRIISSFSVDTLYEISLVNNLFNFDLNKKTVLLKNKKNFKKNDFPKEEELKIPSSIKKNVITRSPQESIYKNQELTIGSANRLNEENNNKLQNDKIIVCKFPKKKSKSKFRRKAKITDVNSPKKKNSSKFSFQIDHKDEIYSNHFSNQEESENQKNNIVNKVRLTRACVYLCFCFTRRRKILENVLLDEGMNIISENIDIFNIFEKMYKNEEIMEKLVSNNTIEMSDKCKIKLQSIYNKYYKI